MNGEKVRLGNARVDLKKEDSGLPSGVMMSMPIIIDVSSLSFQVFRGLMTGTRYLPSQWRIAFLLLDIAATCATQLWIQSRKEEVDYDSLPLGARVRRISGRSVLKIKELRSKQPPAIEA